MTSNVLASSGAPVGTLCPRHRRLDALLLRVGDGDRDAFAVLYDELVQTVYELSVGEGLEPEHCAQITFDVFLCVWLQAGSYDAEHASAWTWVRAIAATTVSAQSRL